jgi:hypothetical protein
MTTYQTRRLNQLIDKLLSQKISPSEFIEYQHLHHLIYGNNDK